MLTLEKSDYKLVLATTSKYRVSLLKQIYKNFEVIHHNINESDFFINDPEKLALKLSIAKAINVQKKISSNYIVIGSDQVGICEKKIIGKSHNFETAKIQLQSISNKVLNFYTAVTVTNGLIIESSVVTTKCKIKKLNNQEIENYLRLEMPYDTVGSIKTEGLGIALMEYIQSEDPTAVIGLPLIELVNLLNNKFGMNPLK